MEGWKNLEKSAVERSEAAIAAWQIEKQNEKNGSHKPPDQINQGNNNSKKGQLFDEIQRIKREFFEGRSQQKQPAENRIQTSPLLNQKTTNSNKNEEEWSLGNQTDSQNLCQNNYAISHRSVLSLQTSIKNIKTKHLTIVKLIAKPPKIIESICVGLVGLFSQTGELPISYGQFFQRNQISWTELQQVFSNPGRLLNLICRTKQLLMSRSISKVSMDIVDQTIAEVNGLNNSGQSEPQAITLLPNFLPILDYLSAVQSFYRDNNINSQNINDQTNLVNHLNQIVQDNHLMEKSNNSQDQQSNEANVRNSSQNEQTEAVRDQDRQQLNSVSSARKDFYENNNNLRYPSQISQDQIADAMINAQQQEQQHNSDKNIQEQFNSPSNISNSNNPQQDTEKADKNGNNKKKNIISEQRYSQPMHLERQTVPKQVVQQQIIHNKQNTPKTNDFEEHSMNSKNQTKSTRHNRLTNFTSFKAHARSKTLLATPTSINQNTNCSNGLTRTNQFVKDTELDTLNERQTKINNSNVVSMVEREQQGRNNMGNDRTNIHNPHQQDPLKQLNETHNKNRLCQIMELRVRKPRVRSVVGGMIRGELSTASKWTESKLEYSDLNRLHLREALSQLDNEVTMLQTTQSRVLFHETRQLRAASQSDCRQKEFDDLMFAKQERDRLLAFQQAKHNQERQLLHDQSVSTIAMIRQSKPQSTQQKQQQLYQKQQNQQNSNYNHNNDKSTNIYNPEAARIPTDISTWLHTSQGMNTERAERECWHNEMMKGSFEQSMSRLTGITNTTTRGTSQNGTRQMKLYLEESSVYSENQMKDVISSIKASQLKHAVLTSNLSHTLSLLKLNDQSRFSLLKNK